MSDRICDPKKRKKNRAVENGLGGAKEGQKDEGVRLGGWEKTRLMKGLNQGRKG